MKGNMKRMRWTVGGGGGKGREEEGGVALGQLSNRLQEQKLRYSPWSLYSEEYSP